MVFNCRFVCSTFHYFVYEDFGFLRFRIFIKTIHFGDCCWFTFVSLIDGNGKNAMRNCNRKLVNKYFEYLYVAIRNFHWNRFIWVIWKPLKLLIHILISLIKYSNFSLRKFGYFMKNYSFSFWLLSGRSRFL